MSKHYFEELHPGRTYATGTMTLTEEAIIRFAREWDPQPFHVEREAAKDTFFGQLIASGLHTFSATFRLCVDAGLFTGKATAGLGYDAIRFPLPALPESTIRASVTVLECRASASRRDVGVVGWGIETLDQDDQVVFTAQLVNFVQRRAEISEVS